MKRALIIEDDDNNYVLVADLLGHAGYHCVKATTGGEGIRMAQTASPDFVILDIQLPDISGFELLEQIRCHHQTAGIPIIAMTSYAMSGDRERLLAAGCDGYLEKPIDPMLFIRQIQGVLGENS